VSILGEYTIVIYHEQTLGTSEVIEVSMTLEPDCGALQFVSLQGLAEYIHYRDVSVFDATAMIDLVTDSEGNSWNNVCGEPYMFLESQTEGVIVEDGIITV